MSSLFGIGAGSASTGFYPETINQSLRFEDGDSARLSKTFGSGGSRTTFTFSAWVKRANITSDQLIFHSFGQTGFGIEGFLGFTSQDLLSFQFDYNSGNPRRLVSNQVFRDVGNWYHICVVADSTNSTSGDRLRMYINGIRVTSFYDADYPSSSQNGTLNQAYSHYISGRTNNSSFFDGYLADVNYLDGTAITDTNGVLDEFIQIKNSVCIPKKISGLSYGTTGFRFTFADSSSLGDDTSGNGNDFTSSGLASTDVVIDTPSNNFCTLNPLNTNDNAGQATISRGNLRFVSSSTNRGFTTGTMKVHGKVYFEALSKDGNNGFVGIQNISNNAGGSTAGQSLDMYNGTPRIDGSALSNTGTFSDGDIMGVAVDVDAKSIQFFKNNSSVYSGNYTTDDEYFPFFYDSSGGRSSDNIANFGQDSSFTGEKTSGSSNAQDDNGQGDFYYAPPSGYLALCSANLPDTTIAPNQEEQGSDFNQVVFYDGNGSNTHQITGVGFKPDMVHIKARNQSSSHYNIDSRRGIGTGDSFKALGFNTSAQEYTAENDQLRSLDADGFTLDDNTDNTWYVNRSSDTYNSWNWRCGSDTPTKTFKVKVVADSTDYGHGTGSNKYQFLKSDGTTGFGTNGVDLDLTEGGTYIFDWSDSSAQSHPIRFSLTNDGTHSSGTSAGSEYTTGVVKDDSSYLTTITLPTTASGGVANLFYYCQNHSGMGAEINTNPITQKGETNFDGTILSVTQVNNTIGMSIATFTAPSGTYYFGHGLSQAPEFFMVKELTGTGNWIAYHEARTPSVPNTKGLYVNSPTLPTTGSNWIQEVSATRIGITTGQLTGTGDLVLYAWHSVDGYCKVGQYEGKNATTNNAFIYTGFLPNIVWIKNVDSGQDWVIRDLKHSGYYTDGRGNSVNLGSSHSRNNPHTGGTSFMMDFLSNGFKILGNNSDIGSSHTFMYIAWASDQTFKFSNAR